MRRLLPLLLCAAVVAVAAGEASSSLFAPWAERLAPRVAAQADKALELQELQRARQDKEARAAQELARLNANPAERDVLDGDPDAYVIIGTGTSTQGYPLYRYWNYCTTEMIYLASEVNTSGNISAVAFEVGSWANVAINSVTVYMKHTTDATLANGNYSLTGYTQVYSGSWPNTGTGWMEVTLSTPFSYNGSDNLQILVLKGYESWTSSSYYRYTTTSPNYRMRADFSDDYQPTYLYQNYNRPNIRLDIASGAADDVGVVGLATNYYTIAAGDVQTITATIRNFGTSTQTSIPVVYNAGGSNVSETWTGSLPSGGTVDYSFTTTWTPSAPGAQDVSCWTELTGDANNDNDTLDKTFDVWQVGTKVGQTFNDVQFPAPGWWRQILVSTYNWERFTTGTYPTCSPLEGAGMTGFQSWYTYDGQARLVGHAWTVGSTADVVSMKFYMYGDPAYNTSNDRVIVEYSTDSTTWTAVDSVSRYNPVADWYEYEMFVGSFSPGQRVHIGLRAVSEYGNNMYLDSLRIYLNPPNDVGIAGFTVPAGVKVDPYVAITPTGTLKNFGTAAQTDVPVQLDIYEGATLVYTDEVTVPGPLDPGATLDVAMDDWTPGTALNYEMVMYTELAGDERPENDTFAKTVATVAWEDITAPTTSPHRLTHATCWDPAGDLLYMTGGCPAGLAGTNVTTHQAYDPELDAWTDLAPMPDARGWIQSSVINGKIYVVGGYTNASAASNTNYEYDIATNTWTTRAPLTRSTIAHTQVAWNNQLLYVLGGLNAGLTGGVNNVDVYDPVANTWS
ncbi:hypothetical protein JXB37_05235, partial [candidate division WOR-3 bacterium]|nr:hypothetical protein [candidate division WOR-3 bacterium]